ncbi:MAG: DUF507 family protein [Nitrospiraceae bacterium]|nr:MAG: DUF507 family protein [Nitrospiraceae bacterium]
MRVPKGLVPVLSKVIIEELLKRELIELAMPREQVAALLSGLILEELMVEDVLNAEVREMLRKYDSEIEKGRLDYRRLFEMTKQKLVKERNIVL